MRRTETACSSPHCRGDLEKRGWADHLGLVSWGAPENLQSRLPTKTEGIHADKAGSHVSYELNVCFGQCLTESQAAPNLLHIGQPAISWNYHFPFSTHTNIFSHKLPLQTLVHMRPCGQDSMPHPVPIEFCPMHSRNDQTAALYATFEQTLFTLRRLGESSPRLVAQEGRIRPVLDVSRRAFTLQDQRLERHETLRTLSTQSKSINRKGMQLIRGYNRQGCRLR